MKKLSLVLALILVFTCCAFVACGDDTDTSSAAGSSTAESSSANSSAASSEDSSDVSSEDASSEDASSEDASSEDASSDASGDVSTGDPAGELKGTNVALNKSYTGGDVASADPKYSANLTDGQASNVGAYDNTWFGLWYNANSATPSNNAPNGVATITIDLGEKTENINAIRVNLYSAESSGILAPKSIVASVSDDGNTYTEVGSLAIPETTEPAWASLATDNVSGRYVKLVITVQGTWTFLNEIEVYAA